MIVVGLMSGTSMDGIDAAIIETDGTPNLLKHIAHSAIEYDPTFRTLLKATEYAIRTSYEESKLDIEYFNLFVKEYNKLIDDFVEIVRF